MKIFSKWKWTCGILQFLWQLSAPNNIIASKYTLLSIFFYIAVGKNGRKVVLTSSKGKRSKCVIAKLLFQKINLWLGSLSIKGFWSCNKWKICWVETWKNTQLYPKTVIVVGFTKSNTIECRQKRSGSKYQKRLESSSQSLPNEPLKKKTGIWATFCSSFYNIATWRNKVADGTWLSEFLLACFHNLHLGLPNV